ncbi:MAG: hypothetical protein P1S60_06000 [Anaerolineae bacterium]|nr:hypothetical protein [Anaerolineae bacterium]
MTEKRKKTPWLLWPFVILWNLVAWILRLTGRVVAAILGLVFMIIGAILTVTLVGAVIGLPMIVLGFLLLIRSIF